MPTAHTYSLQIKAEMLISALLVQALGPSPLIKGPQTRRCHHDVKASGPRTSVFTCKPILRRLLTDMGTSRGR